MKHRALQVAALLLCAASTTALAQGAQGAPGARGRPGGGPGARGGPQGGRCANSPDSLTAVQRGQIRTLNQAFASAHATQLDSLRQIMAAAGVARKTGQSQDEIRAIMGLGRPINEALAPARKATAVEMAKLLTPEQVAAGGMPPMPGGG